MTRRLPVLAIALAATTVLSSCSTFDRNVAARVDGADIADNVLDLLLTPAERPEGPVETSLPGDDARTALTGLIQTKVAEQIAAKFGVDLTASRTSVEAQIVDSLTGDRKPKWDALSRDSRNLLLDYGAALEALSNVPPAPANDLEKLYSDPEQTGHMCLRYMAFKTEAEAVAASAQLAAGANFADLANQANPASNGGVIGGQDGSGCSRLDALDPATLPATISVALFTSKPGIPSDVVKAETDSGTQWYIFLHRPYDEIKDDLAAAVSAAPALSEYYAALSRVDVTVATKYGRWDPVLRSVVPLT